MLDATGIFCRFARVALCATVVFVAVVPRTMAQQSSSEATSPPGERASPVSGQKETCDGPAPVCTLLTRFVTAFNARDFESFRKTFADDISFFVDRPYPPTRLDGRAAAENVFARGFAPYAASAGTAKPPLPPPLVLSRLRVQAFGDSAIITFEIAWPDELARRTLVVHREGDEWRIVHIHASSADIQDTGSK